MLCTAGSDGGNTTQRRIATHMWIRMSSGVELLPRKAHVNVPVAGTTGIIHRKTVQFSSNLVLLPGVPVIGGWEFR